MDFVTNVHFVKQFDGTWRRRSIPTSPQYAFTEFDYSQPGAYFVTIVTHGRNHLFGHIDDEKMVLDAEGKIAEDLWIGIPVHFPNVELGKFVVMPNHIYGILTIIVEATHASPYPGTRMDQSRIH